MSLMINYLYLVIAGIFSGGVVFGGKVLSNLGLSWLELLSIPNLIITLIFLPSFIFEFGKVKKISKTVLAFYLSSITVIILGQYTPLFLGVSVSIVVLCLYTQPLWTILFNRIFFKRKLASYEIIVAALVFAGMIMVINPFADIAYSFWGLFLAISAGVGYGIWVISGTYMARANLGKPAVMFLGSVTASVPFLMAYPLLNMMIEDKSMLLLRFDMGFKMWAYVLAYTFLAQIVCLFLFYKGAEKVPSVHSGLILLIEPVLAVMLDVIFLDTILTYNIIIGGLMIISANAYLVVKNSVKKNN